MIHRFGGIWIMFKISAAAIRMSELFHLCSIHQQPASVSKSYWLSEQHTMPTFRENRFHLVKTNFNFIPRPPLFSRASPIIPTSFLHTAIGILNWALKFLIIRKWNYTGKETDVLSGTGSWVITRFWGSVSCAGRVWRFEKHTDKVRSQLPHLLAGSLEQWWNLFWVGISSFVTFPLSFSTGYRKMFCWSAAAWQGHWWPSHCSIQCPVLILFFRDLPFGIVDTSSSSKHFFTWPAGQVKSGGR